MPSKPALVVEGLGKCFKMYPKASDRLVEWLTAGRRQRHREHWALRDVSFSIAPGETLGVMGRNGAGKTTLLSLLAGILRPTTGRIDVSGHIAVMLNLGAGFDQDASGQDNVLRIGELVLGQRFTAEECAAIAEFAELGDALERPFKTYSAGMQMRLAFATTTQRRPDLLIIDEVMAVGDFFFRRKCHTRIRSFVDAGTAAVLVSHDYTEITQFCRSALVLDSGCTSFVGNASSAVNHYLLSAPSRPETPATTEAISENSDPPIPWPDRGQQIDPRQLSLRTTAPSILVESIACCDTLLGQRFVFSQGETASFFLEIRALRDLLVPVVSVLIVDERGVIIHGQSSHMRGSQKPYCLSAHASLQMRMDISLDLRFGEYQIEFGIAEMDVPTFTNRAHLSFEALGAQARQIARLERVCVIAVTPRQNGLPTQLTHHGLCNLPSQVITRLISRHPDQSQ